MTARRPLVIIDGLPAQLPEGDVITGAPYLHVQHQEASGTAAGTAVVGVNTRPLNAVVANDIAGASLSSNAVTLPEGTYQARGLATTGVASAAQLRLQDTTNTVTILVGMSSTTPSGGQLAALGLPTSIEGRFTLLASTTFELQQYLGIAAEIPTTGLGQAASSGFGEIYASLEFWKIA